jgi:hypothetical protein
MKGVRFTKAEANVIRDALDCLVDGVVGDLKPKHPYHTIKAKLDAAENGESGVAVKPIEDALVKASRGKVLPLEGGHAIASRRMTAMKVTVEEAELVGEWMSRQGWLSSAMTLLDVLNKWYQWLPKARATQPPPSLAPGLGANGTRQGPDPAGKAAPGRRSPQGFR